METAVISIENALDFIMGGNSHFTVKRNTPAGEEHFTFKILKCEPENQPEYFRLSLLVGPDNVNNYRKIGIIKEINGMPKIEYTGSAIKPPAFNMIEKVYYNLLFTQYDMLSNYQIWHTGRCCVCGRLLTVPESIERGKGPECWSKTNAFITQYVDL